MIPRIAFLAALLLCGLRTLAQGPLVHIAEADPSDRGRISIGETVTRRVTLENASQSVVRLRVTGSSCPCTTASLDVDTIGPHDSAVVTLRTRSVASAAPQVYNATIAAATTGSEKLTQEMVLNIRYTPDIPCIISPRLAFMCGSPDAPGVSRVRVRRLDGERTEVAQVELPGDWVRLDGIERDADDANIAVVVLRSAAVAAGVHQGWLGVRLEGEEARSGQVWLTSRVEWGLASTPAGLVWHRTQEGGWSELERRVRVFLKSPAAGEPPELTAASAEPGVEADVHPVGEGGDGWLLTVRLHPERLPVGSRHGTAQVELRDKSGTVWGVLPVTWFALGAWPAQPAN